MMSNITSMFELFTNPRLLLLTSQSVGDTIDALASLGGSVVTLVGIENLSAA